MAVVSPVFVPPLARLFSLGNKVAAPAYYGAVGTMAAVCLAGVILAVLTHRAVAPKTLQRRVTGLTGALSAIMLLFWFVSTYALVSLGPSWR